ncbi:MAG: TonB-dependent siderophore receptor [Cyanobacteria bacterium J06649_4]
MIKKILKRLNLLALLILANSLTVTAEAVSAKSQNSKPTAQVSLLGLAPSAEEPLKQFLEPILDQSPERPLRQAQLPAETITEIVDIRLETTEKGLEILLETAEGDLLAPEITNSQNALIIEFFNTILSLPNAEDFQAFEPAENIALVQVSELLSEGMGSRVRLVVTGTNASPVGTLSSTSAGTAVSISPGTAQSSESEDAIRLLVTGDEGAPAYVEPVATGIRTETPLIETPQSIQVIPEAVLEDQQIIRLNEALRNVPGVVQGNTFGNGRDGFVIRGFDEATVVRDGFRLDSSVTNGLRETANLQQVEVLRGPASILFGNVEPGGVINLVTKQPLAEPFAEVTAQIGSYGLLRPTVDVTGPLNEQGSVRYRFNSALEQGGSFREFETEIDRVFVAPTVAIDLGDRTDLTLDLQYLNDERPFDRGIPPVGDTLPDVPLTTITGEPTDFNRVENLGVGYQLAHQFSDSWQLRNRFRYSNISFQNFRTELSEALGGLNPATGDIARAFVFNDSDLESYEAQTEVIGEFSTGSLEHTLLAGVDLFFVDTDIAVSSQPAPPINLFNPQIGLVPSPEPPLAFATGDSNSSLSRVGLFLQDQIELLPGLNILLGGRVDFLEQSSTSAPVVIPGLVNTPGQQSDRSETAFTPRLGIVYQPIDELSLYASYSRSFEPNTLTETTATGDFLEPEEGEQYEIGIKTTLFDERLAATLSFFDISQTNVAAADPNNANFVVPIGEQSSRGIELDITGEILPGWNVLTGVSLLDAEIEESANFAAGTTPPNAPETTANLWTTYEVQSGNLAGLGFGLGLFYVGERQGDEANSFTLDEYFRTDAAVYYRQENFRVGLNVRNLFDVDYFENGGLARRGATPGEPLSVVGSVSITF